MLELIKDKKGLTLVELLLTLVISFSVIGIVSSVLMQSFRNVDIVDNHNSLRQEANILVAMINSSHLSPIDPIRSTTNAYTISYRKSADNWELMIDNQLVTNQNYDLIIDIEQTVPGATPITKTLIVNSTTSSGSIEVIKRQPLKIKKIKLVNRKDTSKSFEISTTISRL
jgi:Tfp pilus assembly protein PilW